MVQRCLDFKHSSATQRWSERLLPDGAELPFCGNLGSSIGVEVSKVNMWIDPARHRQALSVAAGFIAAAVVAILGVAVLPRQIVTVSGLLARATICTLLVFASTAAAILCGLRTTRHRCPVSTAEVAVRTALPALWLPPLLIFSAQKSWFALVLWASLAVEIARLLAFVGGLNEDSPQIQERASQASMFPILSPPFASILGSVLGSIALQGSVVEIVDNQVVLAGVLFVFGTAALVLRGAKMIRDSPTLEHGIPARRTISVFVAVTFTIAFGWLPHLLVSGSSSSWWKLPFGGAGDAPVAAKSLLGPTLTRLSGRGTLASRVRNKWRNNDSAMGEGFTGVILYPEVVRHIKLVAPPRAGTRGTGRAPSDPLTIPFDGVYWFWQPPADQPPQTAELVHGSPLTKTFRSTAGPLWMEARQNLGSEFDLGLCSAIEVVIDNTDSFPGTVALELKIRNTTLPGKPSETLGVQEVYVRAAAINNGTAGVQTLSFRVPSKGKIRSFDELAVRFHLGGGRIEKSAKIAIDRFRLVPRG
jgi:hypothetical protein